MVLRTRIPIPIGGRLIPLLRTCKGRTVFCVVVWRWSDPNVDGDADLDGDVAVSVSGLSVRELRRKWRRRMRGGIERI